jgi:hypothetical protein
MPVPRLRRPQVRRSPAPSALPPSNAALGVAGTLGAAAQVVGMIERQRMELDEIRANDADLKYRARVDGILLDPKDGLLQQAGTKAIEAFDGYEDRIEQARSEVEAELTSDRQRLLFSRQAERIAVDAGRRAQAHVGQEVRRLDEQTHSALVSQELDTVARLTRAGDAAGVDAAIARQRERVVLFGDRNGLAPDAIAQAKVEAVSHARSLQIATLIDTERVPAARELFAQHADALTAKDRAALEKELEQGGIRERAQKAEDRIMAAAAGDAAAARRAAREEPSEIRDEVVQRVNARLREADDERQAAEKKLFDEALATVERTGSVAGIPTSQWTALAEVRGAREALTSRARQVAEGIEPVQKWDRWAAFLKSTPAELAKLDPMRDLRPHLDNSHFDRALAIVTEAKGGGSGGGNAGVEYSATLSFNQMAENAAQLVGITAEDDPDTYARFERAAAAAVADLERARGGRDKVAPEERQRAIDLVLMRETEVQKKGLFGVKSSTKRTVTLTRDDAGRARVPYQEIDDQFLLALSRRFGPGHTMTRDKVERLAALEWTMQGATPAEILLEIEKITKDAAPRRSPASRLPGPADR